MATQEFTVGVAGVLAAAIRMVEQPWGGPTAVRMHGTGQEGSLLEKNGGLPFGNGFKASLEGPEQLTGKAVLRNFQPEWDAARWRVMLHVDATAEAGAPIHVRGDPPMIFGHRIGGGAPLGGGADTRVGVIVAPARSKLTGAVQAGAANGAYEVRLLESGEVIFRMHAGGIPDALINLFNSGIHVPLP